MTEPEPFVPPPHFLLALTEAHRAMLEAACLGLPGFLGSDSYNRALRRFLSGLNYGVHGWGMGVNLGPRDGVLERLLTRLEQLVERYQSPVSLVGHSLGGIFARELARAHPDKVRQVISLGSPFGEGRMTASIPARLFTALNPPSEIPVDQDMLFVAPPVPTTAIYSKGDGIVNWQTTHQKNGHTRSQSIQVRGSHCGMTLNPSIWLLVAECLATDPQRWRPFARTRWRNLVYPSVH